MFSRIGLLVILFCAACYGYRDETSARIRPMSKTSISEDMQNEGCTGRMVEQISRPRDNWAYLLATPRGAQTHIAATKTTPTALAIGQTLNAPAGNSLNTVAPLLTSAQWYDSETACTIIVSRPLAERQLWTNYLTGAERSYRKHGVEMALNIEEIADGRDTALFFAAVDDSGKVVGGTRAKGPYRSAEDSHAVVEWAGQPGLQAVRKMIDDRVPFGIAEMKTAWVTDDPTRSKALTTTLARTALHTLSLLDIQFSMATSAAHVLDRWRSSGGVVMSKIPATPYPDERYRTKIMFWDRRTFAREAQPQQILKIIEESSHLTPEPTVPALSRGAAQ